MVLHKPSIWSSSAPKAAEPVTTLELPDLIIYKRVPTDPLLIIGKSLVKESICIFSEIFSRDPRTTWSGWGRTGLAFKPPVDSLINVTPKRYDY